MSKPKADWVALKTEYVTGDISYRHLAKKYGVHPNTVTKRAVGEGWVAERDAYRKRTLAKSVAKVERKQVAKAEKLVRLCERLLAKMEESIERLNPEDRQGFRQLSSSLKDIKEIQMVKSEADVREQEARIANLQKQAEREEESKDIVVRFEGVDPSWAE